MTFNIGQKDLVKDASKNMNDAELLRELDKLKKENDVLRLSRSSASAFFPPGGSDWGRLFRILKLVYLFHKKYDLTLSCKLILAIIIIIYCFVNPDMRVVLWYLAMEVVEAYWPFTDKK